MESRIVETESFCISGSHFCRMLALWHFGRLWWAYVLPVVVCAILSFVDIRFLLVALMAVFVIIPIVLLLVYVAYGMDPVNRYNVIKKTLAADGSGITLVIDEEYCMKNPVVKMEWNAIKCRRASGGCVVLCFNLSRSRFLAIPVEAFNDEKDLHSFIKLSGKSCQ